METVRQMDLETAEEKDYSAHVKALYRALYAYRFCNYEEPGTECLTIRLRLNGHEEEEETLKFSMLFLPHPHSDDLYGQTEWQDTQFEVCLPRKERY